MSKSMTPPDGTAREYATRERRPTSEETLDLALLDGGIHPAAQPRPRITDLQHWIDLSA